MKALIIVFHKNYGLHATKCSILCQNRSEYSDKHGPIILQTETGHVRQSVDLYYSLQILLIKSIQKDVEV